ncbi:hypothetical protein ACNKHX_03600 [Shigella flexneri]
MPSGRHLQGVQRPAHQCLELDKVMETAYATAVAARLRTESRGAHSRFDFRRDDDELAVPQPLIVRTPSP